MSKPPYHQIHHVLLLVPHHLAHGGVLHHLAQHITHAPAQSAFTLHVAVARRRANPLGQSGEITGLRRLIRAQPGGDPGKILHLPFQALFVALQLPQARHLNLSFLRLGVSDHEKRALPFVGHLQSLPQHSAHNRKRRRRHRQETDQQSLHINLSRPAVRTKLKADPE